VAFRKVVHRFAGWGSSFSRSRPVLLHWLP
jgi:hypothetical protein